MIFLTDLSFFYYANFFSLSRDVPIVYNDLLSSRHTDSCSLSFWMVQMDARTASLIPMVVYFRKSDDHYIPFITYVWIYKKIFRVFSLILQKKESSEVQVSSETSEVIGFFLKRKRHMLGTGKISSNKSCHFDMIIEEKKKNWNEKQNLFSFSYGIYISICMDKTPFSRLLCQ